MNINLEYLKAFFYVAKNKNITKAAEELVISQPAVSKSIRNLEEQLNCKLFYRSKKGVTLTEEGNTLFKESIKIFDIINETISKVDKNNKKVLNIAIGKVLLDNILLNSISEYNKKYPNIKINITCTSIEGIITKLKTGELDLAVGYYLKDLPKEYEQIKISKALHPIFVCGEKYKELSKYKKDINELATYPFIQSAKGASTREYVDELFSKYGLKVNSSLELLGTSMVTEFIKKGLGITILTKEYILNELEKEQLFQIRTMQKLPERNLRVTYYKKRELTKEVRNFIDILTDKKNT